MDPYERLRELLSERVKRTVLALHDQFPAHMAGVDSTLESSEIQNLLKRYFGGDTPVVCLVQDRREGRGLRRSEH